MNRINEQLDDLSDLPAVFQQVQEQLRFHTETGFTTEEANGYAQQMDDIEEVLMPLWRAKLEGAKYHVVVDCLPKLGGFLKIKAAREEGPTVDIFVESYGHFNSEMCDGSCYQYVYQKVLCYKDGLASGRVPL